MVGLNSNYVVWKIPDNSFDAVYFDFGVIKKFQFGDTSSTPQSINIGASISNLNYAKFQMNTRTVSRVEPLPVINRYGVNYQFHLNRKVVIPQLTTFSALVQADYQLLLNSDYYNGFHTGAEITLLEMLALRVGYYDRNEDDSGYMDSHVDKISDITYGFGLQVPLNKLTKIPLNLHFDYTSLPQVNLTKINYDWENFSTYSVRLDWVMK